MYNKKNKKIQLCFYTDLAFSGLKGHSFSVFGLLEPFFINEQRCKCLTMAREENKKEHNQLLNKISQLILKISKN